VISCHILAGGRRPLSSRSPSDTGVWVIDYEVIHGCALTYNLP
jgi:hypothetical protein